MFGQRWIIQLSVNCQLEFSCGKSYYYAYNQINSYTLITLWYISIIMHLLHAWVRLVSIQNFCMQVYTYNYSIAGNNMSIHAWSKFLPPSAIIYRLYLQHYNILLTAGHNIYIHSFLPYKVSISSLVAMFLIVYM